MVRKLHSLLGLMAAGLGGLYFLRRRKRAG